MSFRLQRIRLRALTALCLAAAIFACCGIYAFGSAPEEKSYTEIELLRGSEDLQCVALGEYLFCYDKAQPGLLRAIDAGTGELAGFYTISSEIGSADPFFSMKTADDCIVVMTGQYAYRIGADLRMQARVAVPLLPGGYDITADLTRVVYQDDLSIYLLDLVDGETQILLAGDYDTLPQTIYSAPAFVNDEQGLLVYRNVGAECPVPALYDLVQDTTLRELNFLYDIGTSDALYGDRLLVSSALRWEPAERLSDDAFCFLPPDSVETVRVSGCYDFVRRQFIPLTFPETDYGVQAVSVGNSYVYYFAEEPAGGWRLHYIGLEDGVSLVSQTVIEASNVEILAVTASGRVLFRYFDLQDARKNGFAVF